MKTNDVLLVLGVVVLVFLIFTKAPDVGPPSPEVHFPQPTGEYAAVPDVSTYIRGGDARYLAWFWKNLAEEFRDDTLITNTRQARNLHAYAGKILRKKGGDQLYLPSLSEKVEEYLDKTVGSDVGEMSLEKRTSIYNAFMGVAWAFNEAGKLEGTNTFSAREGNDYSVAVTPVMKQGCLFDNGELNKYLMEIGYDNEDEGKGQFFQMGPDAPRGPPEDEVLTNGLIIDEQETEKFLQEIPNFKQFGYDGSGKGKTRLLYESYLKFDPLAFTEKQTTGDCFVAWENNLNLQGTKVRMADGSEKAVEDILPGDWVINARNEPSEVVSTFKKPFSGKLYEVKLQGLVDPVVCTPDHKFLVSNNGVESWVAAENLTASDFVLVPFASVNETNIVFDMQGLNLAYTNISPRNIKPKEGFVRAKGSKKSVKRFVEIDQDVGWLLGIYLAEGGVRRENGKPMGVDFSLHRDEIEFAEKIQDIVYNKFGINAVFYTSEKKPSVRIVRLNNSLMGEFFAALCPGKIDSKRLDTLLLSAPLATRSSILQGWLEGDGNVNLGPRPRGHYLNVNGVSVSKQLVQDMQYLARTLAIHGGAYEHVPSENAWAKSRRNRQTLQFRGQNALNILPISSPVSPRRVPMSNFGLEQRVASIKTHEVKDIHVYCIEVPNHNSFIANGIAVHNCVSHSTRNAVDVSRAFEIAVLGEPEDFVVRGATEPIYGVRGHTSPGMSVVRSVKFVSEDGGIALRKKYGDLDLSTYNAKIGMGWGRSGTPQSLKEVLDDNQVVKVSYIDSPEAAADAIYNGYALTVGAMYSFSSTRDENGFARRTPEGWAHAMAWVATAPVSDLLNKTELKEYLSQQTEIEDKDGNIVARRPRGEDDPCFLIVNSWGKWNSGPEGKYDIPEGSFWISYQDAANMIRQKQAFAVGNCQGFEPLPLDDWGFKPWLGTKEVDYNNYEVGTFSLAL